MLVPQHTKMFYNVKIVILLLLVNSVFSSYIYTSYSTGNNSPSPVKATASSFKACCAMGMQKANVSTSCDDYSVLTDKSAGCKSAYTICCAQNKRSNECERGKKHAIAGLPCADLKSNNVCDSISDCCNCCELGKQTRKNGGECSPISELNSECNGIFMDCCKSATSCNPSSLYLFLVLGLLGRLN